MSVEYFRFTQAVTGPRGKGKRLLKWQMISSLLFMSVALWLCTSPITINFPVLARSWPSRRTILRCIIGKWTPRHVPRQKSRPWVEILPKSCLMCSSFELMEDRKLMPSTRKFIKERYVTLRTNQSLSFYLCSIPF